MHFRFSVREILSKLIFIIAASGVIGYLFGHALFAICLSCLLIIYWHYKHLLKLINWLWQSKSLSPPQAGGIWGRIYDGLYRQIKRQRNKQKQLNDKVRKFRDAAEALPDAALVLSDDLTIVWGNKKAENLLGIRWPGDLGQRIDNLLRAPEFAKYLTAAEFDPACVISSPIDNNMQLELRLMAYGSDQILMLARDISRLHRLEAMRRDFVANVSHELKTPLTVVRGYVEMVQSADTALEPHWQKAFTTIEGQVSRMDRLVEQLLNLSKVENQPDIENKQSINMPLLIKNLVEDCHWLNQEKSHHITVDIDSNIGVLGSETELKSACANLISNAIAYTPVHGEIHISWQYQGDKACFSVKDNGFGIKANNISRLTERFYRIDKSRSRDTGGSGLGLAIVKHVLPHHFAELKIKSEVNKGSEFMIIFDAKSLNKLTN